MTDTLSTRITHEATSRRPVCLSVVIPAYNEERTVRHIVDRIAEVSISDTWSGSALAKEVILVNDGSTDATPQILDAMLARERITPRFERMVVLHRPERGGKGAALKTGIAEARGDIILFQDADLECDPQDYPAVLRPLLEDEVDVVLTSRFLTDQPHWLEGTGNPLYLLNHLGVRFLTWMTGRLYRHAATDYASCYKAFRASLLKSLHIEANGFDYEHELVCKLLRRRVPMAEAPVRYMPRSYAEGKKITLWDGMAMGWTVLRWRVAGEAGVTTATQMTSLLTRGRYSLTAYKTKSPLYFYPMDQ